MIDIRKLKELVKLMVENDLSEINLNDQQETVQMKRAIGQATPVVQHFATPAPVAAAATAPAAAAPAAAKPAADSDAGLVAITSPMVGTFYASPNPDSPAFVQVGSKVSAGTTVCLVEAMKVFNEIKAESNGTIERMLVQSGQSVEYGQKLYLIRP